MTRRISLPLVLFVLVLGLGLGSMGTAHAAALSTGAVKKIAAKVVSKAAPKLSVAHAATADSASSATNAANAANAANADKLDNLDSSDLKTTVFSFTVSPTVGAASKVYSLPGLPTGTYLASYSVITNTTNSVTCEIVPSLSAPSTVTAQANSVNGEPGGSVSASAALVTGAQPAFRCTSPSVATFDLASGSISFTRVDTLTSAPAGIFS
jgi:hypothetical protein